MARLIIQSCENGCRFVQFVETYETDGPLAKCPNCDGLVFTKIEEVTGPAVYQIECGKCEGKFTILVDGLAPILLRHCVSCGNRISVGLLPSEISEMAIGKK